MSDDDPKANTPGTSPREILWLRLRNARTAGEPGAAAAALIDLVRNSVAYADFDAAMCFLDAMGLDDGEKLAFAPFGGRHPLDPTGKVSPQKLARLFGQHPLKRIAERQKTVEQDPEATVKKLAPLAALAGRSARELAAELLRALDDLAGGQVEAAKKRRQRIVKRWNRLVDSNGPEFPYPRLCDHCGRPLLLAAKRNVGGGETTPATLHRECRNPSRMAARRATGQRPPRR